MEQLPQQLLPPPPQTANAQAANGNVEPVQLVRQLIAATQAANVVALRREPDPTYRNNVKRFKEFVDTRRTTGELLPGEIYVTRDNVDFYFATYVARKGEVTHDTARRIFFIAKLCVQLRVH